MDSLLALKIRKFADLEDRAVILEENLRVRAGEFNQRKRQFHVMEQNKGKRPMYSPMPKPIQVIKPPQRGTTTPRPACQNCGKPHAGKCLTGTNICFKCCKVGHLVRECPMLVAPNTQVQNPGQKNPAPARVFALTFDDADTSPDVVTSILSLFSHRALVLFDSGATHSFISSKYACLSERAPKPLEPMMSVSSPLGKSVNCQFVLKRCAIKIQDRYLLADLILFDMEEFDVILGMDWLSQYHASLECFKKKVVLRPPGELEFRFCAAAKSTMPKVISALKATTMLKKGCAGFLASLVMPQPNGPKLQNIEVVKDFPDVFPDELPGLPPDREIEFSIDLIPGMAPISKTPYRMAPVELEELKDQLQ
ncbi:uncharacterized protein LOC122298801 [Carya illinoinensis]|uniref:uncharacterized protein LOC122298801 n=1 Tax=Carya illinoinensis TaxID=32201 RepID=UPI001C722C5A|nr:uncharacterized protein LOC122298801 [Carya illinoinensis]